MLKGQSKGQKSQSEASQVRPELGLSCITQETSEMTLLGIETRPMACMTIPVSKARGITAKDILST